MTRLQAMASKQSDGTKATESNSNEAKDLLPGRLKGCSVFKYLKYTIHAS